MSETNGAVTSAAVMVDAADGPTRFTKEGFMRAGLPDTQAVILYQ
jgi:hypothetical protein